VLSGPRPIVSVLILWTASARRHLAFVLRRVLQEGFQVVGLKLHVTSTAVRNAVCFNEVICIALLTLLVHVVSIVLDYYHQHSYSEARGMFSAAFVGLSVCLLTR